MAAPTQANPTGSIHDTLTSVGSARNFDGYTSELWMAYDVQVYDDFVSPSAGVIRSIEWQGIRRTRVAPLRFALSFIADDGKGFPLRQTLEPGTSRPKALYAVTYSMTDVNERPGVTQACDNSPQEPCGSYDYSVVLPAPFSVVAGTRYWLMIQAESSPSAPSSWLWRKGQPDNSFSVPSIANATMPWDFAFALRQ